MPKSWGIMPNCTMCVTCTFNCQRFFAHGVCSLGGTAVLLSIPLKNTQATMINKLCTTHLNNRHSRSTAAYQLPFCAQQTTAALDRRRGLVPHWLPIRSGAALDATSCAWYRPHWSSRNPSSAAMHMHTCKRRFANLCYSLQTSFH